MMWLPLALSLVSALPGAAVRAPVPSIEAQPIYVDSKHEVTIEFFERPDGITIFQSRLPAGWTFEVSVDGNQDGIWGFGTGMPDRSVLNSPDRKFGQDTRNGVFCSQYVFTATANDPRQIDGASECGDLPSNGHVIMSGFDGAMRASLVYEIPSVELFGASQTARVQLCLWDGARMTCQHPMPDLLELKRAFPPAVAPATH